MNGKLIDRIVGIMDEYAKKDGKLRQAWTGDAASIASAEIKTIRIMRLEAEYRKREHRTKKNPASEPWSPKAEPWVINDWDYLKDWREITGWDESDWEKAEEFWGKCDECGGEGKIECSRCDGTGRNICPACCGD